MRENNGTELFYMYPPIFVFVHLITEDDVDDVVNVGVDSRNSNYSELEQSMMSTSLYWRILREDLRNLRLSKPVFREWTMGCSWYSQS